MLTFSSYSASWLPAELLNYRQAIGGKVIRRYGLVLRTARPWFMRACLKSPATRILKFITMSDNRPSFVPKKTQLPDKIHPHLLSDGKLSNGRRGCIYQHRAQNLWPCHSESQLGYMGGITGDPREAEFLGVDALQSIGGEGVVLLGEKIAQNVHRRRPA